MLPLRYKGETESIRLSLPILASTWCVQSFAKGGYVWQPGCLLGIVDAAQTPAPWGCRGKGVRTWSHTMAVPSKGRYPENWNEAATDRLWPN
jgi:hypothetical protein